MRPAIQSLISLYNLLPHPEGGFYKETYRSKETLSTPNGERNLCTMIYFLITEESKSHLHRIKSDESWHFYLGGPLKIVQIHPNGKEEQTLLGQNATNNEKVQHVVPKGTWFGAQPLKGSQYSFVGCTVSPGFDFKDFEMGKRKELLQQFPHAKALIEDFTV